MNVDELLELVERHKAELWPPSGDLQHVRELLVRNGITDAGVGVVAGSAANAAVDRLQGGAGDLRMVLLSVFTQGLVLGTWLVEEQRLHTAEIEAAHWRENGTAYARILQVLAEQPGGLVVPLDELDQAVATVRRIAIDEDREAGTATVLISDAPWHAQG